VKAVKVGDASYLRRIPEWMRTPRLVKAVRAEHERRNKRRFIRDRCFNRFRVLALDQLRGLPKADKSTSVGGVYFLWRGPKLVYIGQSENDIRGRLAFHKRYGRGYTHATYEAMEGSCARWCESDYIKRYWPEFNRIC
jgi:hypothetical protein